MKINLNSAFLASIAIAGGVIVLLGYFVDLPLLTGLRTLFLRWAVILTAVALLAGIYNLLKAHGSKITQRKPGALYSLVLILGFGIALTIAVVWGPASEYALWLYSYIQVPVETSLLATLAVVLAYAVARLPYRRLNLFSLVFVATVLFTLVSSISIPGLEIPVFLEIRSWMIQVISMAGARGILIGVTLGMIATGLRVLVSADRPYGG